MAATKPEFKIALMDERFEGFLTHKDSKTIRLSDIDNRGPYAGLRKRHYTKLGFYALLKETIGYQTIHDYLRSRDIPKNTRKALPRTGLKTVLTLAQPIQNSEINPVGKKLKDYPQAQEKLDKFGLPHIVTVLKSGGDWQSRRHVRLMPVPGRDATMTPFTSPYLPNLYENIVNPGIAMPEDFHSEAEWEQLHELQDRLSELALDAAYQTTAPTTS